MQMNFRKELEVLLNKYSMENNSDTPDFILAEFLTNCLWAFDIAIRNREQWHGRIDETSQTRANDASIDAE